MDIGTALIALGCIVVLCFIGYLLSVYGINRKSYDDVVAEQKERMRQEMQVNREKKEKQNKKKSNKKEKKEKAKESNQPVHQRVGFSEQPLLLNEETKDPAEDEALIVEEEAHMEVAVAPEVKILPEPEVSKKKKKSQDASKQKSKPTEEASKTKAKNEEHNKAKQNKKESKSVVEEEPSKKDEAKPNKKERTSSVKEQTEEPVKPQRQKKEMHKQTKAEPSKEVTPEVEPEKEAERSPVEESSSTSPSPPPTEITSQQPPKQSKKSKKQKIPKDLEVMSEQMTSQILIQILRGSHLDQNEIQLLIDTLLNKQNSASNQWIERGQQRAENVSELKKKLEEAENVSQNTMVKVRELRTELNTEKSRSSQKDKQLRDMMTEKQNEIQVLHTTIKRTTDKHALQINQLKSQLQQAHNTGKKASEESLTRLSEENQQLKLLLDQAQMRTQQQDAAKQEMDQVYQTQAAQLQALTMELKQSQERLGLIAMKDEEIIRLREENENLAAQVASVHMRPQADGQEEPHDQELAKKLEEDANEKLNHARLELQEKQGHVVHLSEQLQHRDQMVAELQSRLAMSENSQQAVLSLQNELAESTHKLKEYESATSQCHAEINRLNSEIEGLKGSTVDKEKRLQELTEQRGNTESRLSEKRDEVESLLQQLNNLKNTMEKKDSEILRLGDDLSKTKNELKQAHNHSTDDDKLVEKEKMIEALQKELGEKTEHLHKLGNDTQKDDELERLRLQVQSSTNEKEERIKELAQSREVMQRLCPHIVLEESDYLCWLNNYVVAVSKELKEAKEGSKGVLQQEEKVTQLEARLQENNLQNERLAKEVQHYRTVLTDTESMLSSLQGSVDSAEHDWKIQVEKLVVEKKELEEKLEATKELQAAQEAASEMQEKLVELQRKLQGEEEEKKELAAKYNEVHHACEDLRGQVDEHLERTRQITEELESVRNSTNELEKEKIKLSSLVTIGQAALKEEQETVQRLQKELSVTKGATVNGSSVEQLTNGQPHEQTSEVESISSGTSQSPISSERHQKKKKKLESNKV